jgi:hypothetical protein
VAIAEESTRINRSLLDASIALEVVKVVRIKKDEYAMSPNIVRGILVNGTTE